MMMTRTSIAFAYVSLIEELYILLGPNVASCIEYCEMKALEMKRGNPDAGEWDANLLEAEANYVPNDSESVSSSGQSVYDAESVVGESGRLYHGYKQGKYLLPNDAVRALRERRSLEHETDRASRPNKTVLT